MQLGAAVCPLHQLVSSAAVLSRVAGDLGVPVPDRALDPRIEQLHGQLPVLENTHSVVTEQGFLVNGYAKVKNVGEVSVVLLIVERSHKH